MSRRGVRLSVLIVAGALVALGGSITLPYYSIGPGPAREVEPLIRIEGHPTFGSAGRFVLTSITFRQLTPFTAITAWLDPDLSVVSRETLFAPGESSQQEQTRAISQMDQSKLDAASVVLKQVTGYPKAHGQGVLVESTQPGCAAQGRLFPGDLIRSINGTEISSVRQASRAIGSAPSGSTLSFDLTVDGKPESVSLVRAPCGGSTDPLVGVRLMNSYPIGISIATGDIGGPSAGLMFALGLYDLLTPGDLTGGRTIAGTGEIGVGGRVYPIGGVDEKVIAAADAGARVFLVPEGNLEAARGAAQGRDLRLVPISTFDDALSWLRGNG
jgi:PDZ domain-containing protein